MGRDYDREKDGETRYDSFQVRLWSRSGTEELLRLEVRHTQTGTVDAATGVRVESLVEIVEAVLSRAVAEEQE